MRLLNVHTLQFREFYGDPEPYVVTSHRWSVDNEAMLHDIQAGLRTNTTGYKKVQSFAKFVRDHFEHVNWMWIDTCCINQASDREVSEAVNSMFRWYAQAEACLAYLADVNHTIPFTQSEWFRRGWTLQELLAPQLVLFLNQEWRLICCKGDRKILSKHRLKHPSHSETSIAAATHIPQGVIFDFARSHNYSVEARLKWMAGRETTRAEDMIYSLFGIFDVTLPVLYGEGVDKARKRLLREISETSHYTDQQPDHRSRNQTDEMDRKFGKDQSLAFAFIDNNKLWTNEEDRLNYAFAEHLAETGLVEVELERYSEAEAHFQEAQECLDKLPREQLHDELAFVKFQLAVCAFHIRHPSQTESALLAVIDLLLADECRPLDLCVARHLLSQALVRTGKLDEALDHCRDCYSERCRILKSNDRLCYESLALLARIYELRGDTKQAARYFAVIRAGSQNVVQPSLFSTLWPTVQNQWGDFRQLTPSGRRSHDRNYTLRARFSSDGQLFASSTKSGAIKLWDVASGKEIIRLTSSGSLVFDIAISRDGKQIAAVGASSLAAPRNWTARVWDRNTSTVRVIHDSGSDHPLRIAFSPEGILCAVRRSNKHKECRLTDLVSREVLMRAPVVGPSTTQASSHDGMLIANANGDGLVRVWRMGIGDILFSVQSAEKHIKQLKFSGDGTKLAVVSDGAIAVWSIVAKREIERLDIESLDKNSSTSDVFISEHCNLVVYRKRGADDEYALREINNRSAAKTLKWRGLGTRTVGPQKFRLLAR